MRILCLHGHGTSGTIFKSQTFSFRSRLPESYTFDFPNAPRSSDPTPGIELFYDGPFHNFWSPPSTPSKILAAHAWLQDYITAHGPYDGAIAFSQGTATLASFLLYARREGRDPPFKFAVFICGGLPLCVAEELGMYVPPAAHEAHNKAGEAYNRKTHELANLDLEALQPDYSLWDDPPSIPDVAKAEGTRVLGLDFSSLNTEKKIHIPTLHIYGRKDPLCEVAVQLAMYCDEGKREIYDHGGGHEVPRAPNVGEEMAERIKKYAEAVA